MWSARHDFILREKKRSMGSLKECKDDEYLEYRLYWCSFDLENYGEGGGIFCPIEDIDLTPEIVLLDLNQCEVVPTTL